MSTHVVTLTNCRKFRTSQRIAVSKLFWPLIALVLFGPSWMGAVLWPAAHVHTLSTGTRLCVSKASAILFIWQSPIGDFATTSKKVPEAHQSIFCPRSFWNSVINSLTGNKLRKPTATGWGKYRKQPLLHSGTDSFANASTGRLGGGEVSLFLSSPLISSCVKQEQEYLLS